VRLSKVDTRGSLQVRRDRRGDLGTHRAVLRRNSHGVLGSPATAAAERRERGAGWNALGQPDHDVLLS
jgi:hypothetical protein